MPEVIYKGPSDTLLVHGHEYHPGDRIRLSGDAIGNLTRNGERFGYPHDDQEPAEVPAPAATFALGTAAPVLEPDPKPKPEPEPEPIPAPKAEQHAVRAATHDEKEK